MPRKKRDAGNYYGGQAFTRARKQFQVLYEKEGTFKRALAMQDLILWPDLEDKDGKDVRPPEHILNEWAVEVDEGKADIPPKLRQAFLARYDAYTEAVVRDALVENSRTSKALAIMAREGNLAPEKSSQYLHANSAVSFMFKETQGKRTITQEPRRIQGAKFLAPKKKPQKQLGEPVVNGEFRVVS